MRCSSQRDKFSIPEHLLSTYQNLFELVERFSSDREIQRLQHGGALLRFMDVSDQQQLTDLLLGSGLLKNPLQRSPL